MINRIVHTSLPKGTIVDNAIVKLCPKCFETNWVKLNWGYKKTVSPCQDMLMRFLIIN